MKPKFESLNSITKTTIKDTGFTETRKVLDGSLFSESDKGLLELLKTSLSDEEKRKTLLSMLSYRTEDPAPLSKIINILDKFNELKDIELTPEDLELINFTIKYFENWFYDGEWTKISNKQNTNENAYAYFSVPAGIINILTKLKDSQKNSDKIVSFDLNRLEELQKEVENFANTFLSKERLESILKENLNPEKRVKIEYILNNREAILDTFKNGELSLRNEFKMGSGSSGSKAPDLYLVKTSLIAAEMKRREQKLNPKYWVFTPDKAISKNKDKYIWFDFSQGKDKNSSMHYPKERIVYAKFLVEYLNTKK